MVNVDELEPIDAVTVTYRFPAVAPECSAVPASAVPGCRAIPSAAPGRCDSDGEAEENHEQCGSSLAAPRRHKDRTMARALPSATLPANGPLPSRATPLAVVFTVKVVATGVPEESCAWAGLREQVADRWLYRRLCRSRCRRSSLFQRTRRTGELDGRSRRSPRGADGKPSGGRRKNQRGRSHRNRDRRRGGRSKILIAWIAHCHTVGSHRQKK